MELKSHHKENYMNWSLQRILIPGSTTNKQLPTTQPQPQTQTNQAQQEPVNNGHQYQQNPQGQVSAMPSKR